MPSKKTPGFNSTQRDRLIVGLTMNDAVAALNLAMRVRKLELLLTYDEDHFPRLYLQRKPDVAPQQIMKADPRSKLSYTQPPSDFDLFHGYIDITDRLRKLDSRLLLVCERPTTGPRKAKLQLYVAGAERVALTLMETTKGSRLVDASFQLPDGSTP